MTSKKVDKSSVLDVVDIGEGDLDSYGDTTTDARPGRLDRPIMKVSVSSIIAESPVQSRQVEFDPKNISLDAELAESIREHGVLEPIMVTRISLPGDPVKYQLIFGSRRTNAARYLGMEFVPAIIANDQDDFDLLSFAENTGRRDLSPFEQALALIRVQENNPDLSTRKLAKKTGISHSLVSNLMRAYKNSSPALRGLFSHGTDARAVVDLQDLFNTLSERDQVSYAEKLKGLSRKKIAAVRELLSQDVDIDVALNTHSLAPPKPTSKSNSRKTTVRRNSKSASGKAKHELDIDDEQIALISSRTGASQKDVKGVLSKAGENGADLDAVFLVCAYIGNGGTSKDALLVGMQLSENRKALRLLNQYLDLNDKAKKLVQQLDTAPQKDFMRIIFQGI